MEKKLVPILYDYAAMYDALIGNPCLEGFMANYIAMVFKQFVEDAKTKTLSLGCGTGLIEEYIFENHGISKENLFGFDLSNAMIEIAKRRIQAEQGDVLDLDPAIAQWDIAFTGLNVLHYVDHELFEESIQRTASIVRPGGFFFGDFITPDHIRWYPNLMTSSDSTILSLRTPQLKESEGRMYMESHIINLDFSKETVFINDAGNHLRHLPAMHRVRTLFEKHLRICSFVRCLFIKRDSLQCRLVCINTLFYCSQKESMTLQLTKHSAVRLLSLVLGLLYSYYIIYWHEVYVDMAVRKLEDIGLAAFNTKVMKVVLGISGSLCLFIAWRLKWQYKHQRRPQNILHGLLIFTLLIGSWITAHTLLLLEMNVELIHVPMYAILAFFLFFAFRHWTMIILVALPIMLYDEWYQYMSYMPIMKRIIPLMMLCVMCWVLQ